MTWEITKHELDKQMLLVNESLFALGNGYLGVRGNFEEGYPEEIPSIRGTYLNAFYDITEIQYGEKAYGFPETGQKMLNVIDAQTIEIFLEKKKNAFLFLKGSSRFFPNFAHETRVFRTRHPLEIAFRKRNQAHFFTVGFFYTAGTVCDSSENGAGKLFRAGAGDFHCQR